MILKSISRWHGQARQAQVMVIKARVTETGEVTGLFGRGNEIHRFPHPRAPEEGTVGAVTPISGRPHAFEFEYTPSNGEPPFMIEIITHHSTPGHGN